MQNYFEGKSSTLAVQCRNVGLYYPPAKGLFLNQKSKEGYWALKDLSFELDQGDILGLVGPNGAGKSTALLVISRVLSPDRGTVNTFNLSTILLALNAGMAPNLTGRKNIFLSGLTLGIPKQVINEKMDEIIAFTDIGDFIDKPISTYSTGMKSRLGFSTALFLEPKIFLIDETFGVGDQAFRKKSTEALNKKLSKETTAIIVSHSEDTIKELCNKALLMEQGKDIAFGSPDEIFKIYNED